MGPSIAGVGKTLKRLLLEDDHNWVLLVVAMGWLFALGVRLAIPAILPQIKAEFRIDNATAGLAVTSLWLAYAFTQFPAGALTDRFSERPILIAGAGITVLGLSLFATTPVFVVFIFACALFGIGTGLYAPPRVTLLSRLFPDDDSTVLGLTWSAGNVGAVLLPVVVSFVAVRMGWRVGLGLLSPFFVVITLSLYLLIPEPRQPDDAGRDVSLIKTALRILTELRSRPVVIAGTGMAIVVFIFQSLSTFLPTYLIETKGFSQQVAVVLYGLFLTTGVFFQPLAGVFADLTGYKNVLVTVALFSAASLLLLPFVGSLFTLGILLPLIGARRAIGPVSNAYIVNAIADDVEGASYGLLRTFILGVGSTGSTVTGVLIDSGKSDLAFLLLAGLTAVVGILFLFLPRAVDSR